ncbi:hypothetical protein [Thermosynechococcus sp.]|uniref:hypothetical protein n=1 Tax=Thermosynechococcus sp. TaxID=2814275 RepID=UPI0039192484
MSEWHKLEWNMEDQEWQAIANSRRQIEQSCRRATQRVQGPSQLPSTSLDAGGTSTVSPPPSVQPIGIQPWQAELTKERFAGRSQLSRKWAQVELPQFARRR